MSLSDSPLGEGHRMLLNRLLGTAKSGLEELQSLQSELAGSRLASPPWQGAQGQQPAASRPATRSTPRGSPAAASPAGAVPLSPGRLKELRRVAPVGAGGAALSPSKLGPNAGAAAAAAAAPAPQPANQRAPGAAELQHPGPLGGLSLSSLGGLLSPPGGGWGPLSTTRSGGWRGLDVVVTPHLSQDELSMLLDALNGDDAAPMQQPAVH